MKRYLPLLLSIATLPGCSMAPDYHAPATVPIAPSFKEEPGWSVAVPSDAVARGDWWRLFNDPVLDALEQKVSVTNQNVAAARAAYQAARALVAVQRSALFPTISGSSSATRTENFLGSSAATTPTATTSGSGSHFALSIGASWEPDLWGRLGNKVSQARNQAEASAGDLVNATLSAQGELATNYVQLRGVDALRALLDQTIADYQRALVITSNKYRAGTVSHADVYQAQTLLSNAIATRQDLERQRAVLEHAIAVLVGESPSNFSLSAVTWNPTVPAVPSILPGTLLQRRPDIAAAERRVAAANANIGVQRGAYFPDVTLSGTAGTSGSAIGQLFSAATSLWSLGLSTVATLLDFGARHGQVMQARAQFDQAGANYRQTVLTAFQQVEDGLAAARILAEEAKSRSDAEKAAVQAEAIAKNQYRSGLVDYSEVIVAQTTALSARQVNIQTAIDRQTAAISLIQAIGGNWRSDSPGHQVTRKSGKQGLVTFVIN